MKHFIVFILLAVILAACAGESSIGKPNCSKEGDYCVEVRAEEPIRFGEPVTVVIMVTSEKDIPDMSLALSYNAGTFTEEPQAWEKDVLDYSTFPGGESWRASIDVKQPLTFTRKLYPKYEEGWFSIRAMAATTTSRAGDVIIIHLTREGGEVYLANTPLPITPGPELGVTIDPNTLATLQAMPT